MWEGVQQDFMQFTICSLTVIGAENDNLYFNLYPNPFTDYATIEFENKNSENYSIKIYNNLGQVVKIISNIITNKIKINRENLSSGIYFFQLKNDSGIRQTGKLVVE
jgi:hypothetical protein